MSYMIKGVGSKYIQRKDSRKNLIIILLILYKYQLSSIKEICKYCGNKNYKTTKKYVNYLLKHKIICRVSSWQGERFYVKVDSDQILKTRVNYYTTQHRMSLKLNDMMDDYPQLKESILKNGIDDFTKITKSNIPKQSFDVTGLNDSCTAVVKHLNLIFLATKVLINEEKQAKKNNSDNLQLVKRQARICELWLDLESFLEKYFGKPEAEFMAMAKSYQLDYQMELYRKYYSHVTHSKTTFSEYLDLLRQIKFGYKQEYSQSKGMSLQCLSKILKKFTDWTGRIDIRYLGAMIRIETASSLKSRREEIEDLFFIDLLSDEMSRTRIPFYKEDKIENVKTRKIIKEIYPQMR